MSDPLKAPTWAETLIESLPEGILILDASGCILSMNRSGERITGWTVPEASGKSVKEILPLGEGKGRRSTS